MVLDIVNNNIRFLFPTPVLQMEWPDAEKYNPQMVRLITGLQQAQDTRRLSNEGGWQSDDDLLNNEAECIQALKKWLVNCILHIYDVHHVGEFRRQLQLSGIIPKFRIGGWANVNSKGHSNIVHNHPACVWSGVYYARAMKDSGSVAFLDPRHGANMLDTGNELFDLFGGNIHYIEPKEGMVVIFPSWIHHFVTPNKTDQDRISIAFNSQLILESP